MNATRARAALMKFNLVGLVLLLLSGAERVPECPAPPVWLVHGEPVAAAGCPGGSCDKERG